MLRRFNLLALFLGGFCSGWSLTATAQVQAFVKLSENDQLVVCDNPSNSFEEKLFSRLAQSHELIFFSKASLGTSESTPKILGKKGGAFYEAKPAIYLIDEATVHSHGCYPLDGADLAKLRKGLDAKIQLEKEVVAAIPAFRSTVENSICLPVFRVPLSPKITVFVSRIPIGSQGHAGDCTEKYEKFIIYGK
ncbi:hypothetical protein K3X41_05870 [Aliiroseovarius crassostreae]|uniref:hypothetical protein n=1 Tax=Aliiroseovarius crassostreae TaxID=154981 RepID=UPI00220AF623|nr:hypothetical protein [Aliiroseovarius crassostreae]UWQ12191.1 hypothetical protein K3X41_05870 [Aliiroseovarius crassostreae]